MLYHQEYFGTREAFEALWEKDSIIPKIDWAAYIPEHLLVHWEVILAWDLRKRIHPSKLEDSAARELAEFFAEKAQDLPFRLANLREKGK